MIHEHCTSRELSDHLREPRPEVTRRLDACAVCRDELELTRQLEQALASPLVWQAVESVGRPAALPASVAEKVAALAEEDREASELLAPALVSIRAFQEHEVETAARYRSAGVVRVLTREAKKVRDSVPKFALLLATAAVTIAGKLGHGAVRSSTLGTAWLERGIASAALGKYRDAERALTHAEDAFATDDGGTTWDLATVWLSRANIYNETDRFEEALDLASRAAEVFLSEYGDVTRYHRASLVRGTVLYYRLRYWESIEVFEAMLTEGDGIEDQLTYARTLHNAANSYVGTGELDKATDYYSRALVLWDELRCHSELVRTQWALASIDVARGNWETGYRDLDHARRQLGALGIMNDEALVRLEIAEVLILLGRAEEVPALLEGIVLQFATEGMMRKARLALAWLTEAKQRTPTREQIRHVREYLARLPTNPSEPFVRLK